MPSFDIVRDIKPAETFRVSSIVSNFDLDINHLQEHFKGEINLDNDWQIGLIVGGQALERQPLQKTAFHKHIFAVMSTPARQ